MGKALSILVGLILIALGVAAIAIGPSWKAAVLVFIQGGLVIMAIMVGLGILVFGLSELRAGPEEPPVLEASPPAETPGEQPTSESPE